MQCASDPDGGDDAGKRLGAAEELISSSAAHWPGSRLRWLTLAWGLMAIVGCSANPAPPDIILISVDTLRADHLEAWGYPRATAPAVASLARRGVRFDRGVSPSSWTLPSMATLHTSLYPSEHGAVNARHRLTDDHLTLAEALQDAGYDTIGVTSHDFVGRERGFAQGFRAFDTSQILPPGTITSSQLTERALSLLAERGPENERDPFFLWVHYFDPHYTYVRHPRFDFASGIQSDSPESLRDPLDIRRLRKLAKTRDARGRSLLRGQNLAFVTAVYDEEIANTDEAIGALLEGVESLDPSRRLVVALTADHGEMFMEHGRLGHEDGHLYQPVVHVPLVIAGDIESSLHGRVVEDPVEVRWLAHTLAKLAEIEPNPFEGSDLLTPKSEATRPTAFIESRPPYAATPWRVAVISDGWKLIHDRTNGKFELYELSTDPSELRSRWTHKAPVVAAARRRLKRMLDRFQPEPRSVPAAYVPTDAEAERLKALGYLR